MSAYSIGTRVVAICSSTQTVFKIFGFGVYEGDQIPPKGVHFMGIDFARLNKKNPAIKLDDGKYVYGCECWWGPEDVFKKKYPNAAIEIVDIDAARAENPALSDAEQESILSELSPVRREPVIGQALLAAARKYIKPQPGDK